MHGSIHNEEELRAQQEANQDSFSGYSPMRIRLAVSGLRLVAADDERILETNYDVYAQSTKAEPGIPGRFIGPILWI